MLTSTLAHNAGPPQDDVASRCPRCRRSRSTPPAVPTIVLQAAGHRRRIASRCQERAITADDLGRMPRRR
jgi:hypothetical protein